MKIFLIGLFSTIFLMTGCGTAKQEIDSPRPGDETPIDEPNQVQDDDKIINSDIVSTEFNVKDGHFTFTLKNISDKGVTLNYSNLQEYEYVIIDQSGNHLYTYSMDKMFGEAFVEITLSPGEEHMTTVDIHSILSTLEPGAYTIEIWSVANEADGLKAVMELVVDASGENQVGFYSGEIDNSSVEIIDENNLPHAYRLTENVKESISSLQSDKKITFSFFEMNGQRFLTMITAQ
ncbi:MAG: BsuPI-related putative proteinase inhibitor [Bacillaceae bacterium]|nr:BsuPI-related putative proteinase inhibitor [Bacillaceae bacterium]